MNSRPKNCVSGFTLVEILIAVFIFAVLMTTLFSSFNTFVASSKAIKSSIENDDRIRLPLEIISRDLFSIAVIQPPRYNKPSFNAPVDPCRFLGEERGEGGKIFAKLGFASLNHISINGNRNRGVAGIVYYVRQSREGSVDLCRSDSLKPAENRLPSQCDPILFKDIKRFDIRYYNKDGQEHSRWDSESAGFDYGVPAAVKLTIAFRILDGERIAETMVHLPVEREVVN